MAGMSASTTARVRKDRVVPMGRKATQYAKEYLRHVRGRLTEKRRDERALFVGVMGKRINPIIVERLIRGMPGAPGSRSA